MVKKETTEFDEWPLELRPYLSSAKVQKIGAFICLYYNYFIFNLKDFEGCRGKLIHIQLKDNHAIF